MSWLVNSMTPEIGENFLLYETAHEIWEAYQEFYYTKENTSAIFEIESSLHDLQQNELNITQYYNTLTRSWQQLDVFEEHRWSCPEDAKLFKSIIEQKRIFKFLMGLNKNLDEVRGRVLGIKSLPSIREVFFEIRREESRKKVMMGDTQSTYLIKNAYALTNRTLDSRGKRGWPWYDHCGKLGHIHEKCWKLHGRPSDRKPFKSKNPNDHLGNHATSEDTLLTTAESCHLIQNRWTLSKECFLRRIISSVLQ